MAVLDSIMRDKLAMNMPMAAGEDVARSAVAEAVPLLFQIQEENFCREEAKDALKKVREMAPPCALLLIHGVSKTAFYGPYTLHQRPATLQLLEEFGISGPEWQDLQQFLTESGANIVISAACIGSRIDTTSDQRQLDEALFRISEQMNWAKESEIEELLDIHPNLAHEISDAVIEERTRRLEHANWLAPSWRILRHIPGRVLEGGQYGAA